MTREDIIAWAREAGMNVVDDQYSLFPFLERFAALVASEKDKKIQELEDIILELQERME